MKTNNNAAKSGENKTGIPGILIAAPFSGSGKTAVSSALMGAFQKRGLVVRACKCGPDYIDPMFHREILGVDSRNLDLYFASEDELTEKYIRHGAGADLVITEGVMGYYDGMALDSTKASSYHVARTLGLPVILVISGRGAALTLAAVIKGLAEYREDSRICGVILNRISAGVYPRLKAMLEGEMKRMGWDIPVLGYVPGHEAFDFAGRHLGLVTPGEVAGVKKQLQKGADILEETLDLDRIIGIAGKKTKRALSLSDEKKGKGTGKDKAPRVAVALDKAFCFYYRDNLELLDNLGCRLIFFSPLTDKELPEAEGILLGGGYPELYARQLSSNQSMRASIGGAIDRGIPCLAECGGFLYLHERLKDAAGRFWPMTGVIKAEAFPREGLSRFGYVEISSSGADRSGMKDWLMPGEKIKGHEFHYWDSTDRGRSCTAKKPGRETVWECIHAQKNLFAGFPHLYLPSAVPFAERFVEKCSRFRER